MSIVINNCSYSKCLGAAIHSALAFNCPDKEAIVVADDGPTDGSPEVILAYGSRIVPIFLPNGGQNSVCNAASDRSTGDIILFLDLEDILFPSIAEPLRLARRGDASKLRWSIIKSVVGRPNNALNSRQESS